MRINESINLGSGSLEQWRDALRAAVAGLFAARLPMADFWICHVFDSSAVVEIGDPDLQMDFYVQVDFAGTAPALTVSNPREIKRAVTYEPAEALMLTPEVDQIRRIARGLRAQTRAGLPPEVFRLIDQALGMIRRMPNPTPAAVMLALGQIAAGLAPLGPAGAAAARVITGEPEPAPSTPPASGEFEAANPVREMRRALLDILEASCRCSDPSRHAAFSEKVAALRVEAAQRAGSPAGDVLARDLAILDEKGANVLAARLRLAGV